MGDGRERETSVNDKGAGQHGNGHTTKSHGTAQGEKSDRGAGGAGEDGDKQRGGAGITSVPPLQHLLLPFGSDNPVCLRWNC